MRLRWLLGCLAFALSAAPAVATTLPDGHLYLGRYSGYYQNGVVRFPLYGGIPTPADLYIKPPYGGQIAVSAGGTLYASGVTGNFFTQVGAFAFGQTKPSQIIEVPTMPYCYSDAVPDPIYGMATDPVGNLYLLINTFFSFAHGRPPDILHPAHVSPNWQLCFGVAIFGPHQHGHEAPHWEIPRYSQYFGGVAADNAANVYVDDGYTSQTVEYSTIFSHPKITRTLAGKGGYYQVACDSAGDVYILLSGSVYVYRPTGSKPRNVFTLLSSGSYYTIAATTRYVYVQDYDTHAIEVYDANATGSPLPVASFTTYDLGELSVGP